MKYRKYELLVFFITLTILSSISYTNALKTYSEPVKRPMPSLPEPVIYEGILPVEVISNTEPTNIKAKIWSKYETAILRLSENPIRTSDSWIIRFSIPEIRSGLYDLNLVFYENEKVVNVTQLNSVWVLEEWPEEIKICHITDIHQPYGAENFSHLVYEQNLINPDLILVTGDVVDVETIRSAWENLQITMEKSEVPIFILPGNHDHTDDARFYKQYGGMTNYTVTIGDFLILALNSHGGGYINHDEIQWADKVLKENPNKIKIMAFHHPLLSSEYEDDQGTVRGGEITGTWKNIQELKKFIYFTWSDNMDHAEEILRVIEENEVQLILAGHVHRDMIYILNAKHSFVTTTTIGGGTSQYRGYRLIKLFNNGTYQLDQYGQENKFNPPNSIPLEKIHYFYKKENDGSQTAVSATIKNDLEMPLKDAELEFIVNKNISPSSYSFYPEQQQNFEVITTQDGHEFIITLDVESQSVYNITIAAEEDTIDPEINLHLPQKYDEATSPNAIIEVTDSGWGIKDVKAFYCSETNTNWTPIEITQRINLEIDEWDITQTKDYYEVPLEGVGEITVRVEAEDYAGNTAFVEETTTPISKTPEYTLSINSEPMTVEILINGNPENTPYTEELPEGPYIIEVEPTVTENAFEYMFQKWGDGETSTSRSIILESNASLEIIYEEVPPEEEEPPEEDEDTRGGIPIPTSYIIIGLIASTIIIYVQKKQSLQNLKISIDTVIFEKMNFTKNQ
jgi:predicted MPP superfamily phosphohydrolase